MPKLYSSKQIEKVLFALGFSFISQKGSHQKYKKGYMTVILPANKKQIPIGTFKAILKQAGVSQAEFDENL